jgi:hypothetical protein
MYEENINNIVSEANDQLDILKVYIRYRATFHVERLLNWLRVLASVAGFSGTLEFNDVVPVRFDLLIKAYDGELQKGSVIKATELVIKELDSDIEKLMSYK